MISEDKPSSRYQGSGYTLDATFFSIILEKCRIFILLGTSFSVAFFGLTELEKW